MSGVEAFIERWSHLEGGAERANYALFLTELCDVIDVPRPDPASATTERNDYVFERAAEERRSHIRWLRPDYQKARAGVVTVGGEQTEAELVLPLEQAPQPFPRDPYEQAALVAAALAEAQGPVTAAARWKKDKRTERKVETILAAFRPHRRRLHPRRRPNLPRAAGGLESIDKIPSPFYGGRGRGWGSNAAGRP